jgi:hypothetical protein
MINITPGTQYGKLTTIKQAGGRNNGRKWLCSCSCGNEIEVYSNSLNRGERRSCGCLLKDKQAMNESVRVENHIKTYDYDEEFSYRDVLSATGSNKAIVSRVLNKLYKNEEINREAKFNNSRIYAYHRPKEKPDFFSKAMKSLCISPLNTGL